MAKGTTAAAAVSANQLLTSQGALDYSCIEVSVKLHCILKFTAQKGDLFLSPPHDSLISIVHENQGGTLPYSDQNDRKLCLYYCWDYSYWF